MSLGEVRCLAIGLCSCVILRQHLVEIQREVVEPQRIFSLDLFVYFRLKFIQQT